jgi:hypothetical protein
LVIRGGTHLDFVQVHGSLALLARNSLSNVGANRQHDSRATLISQSILMTVSAIWNQSSMTTILVVQFLTLMYHTNTSPKEFQIGRILLLDYRCHDGQFSLSALSFPP